MFLLFNTRSKNKSYEWVLKFFQLKTIGSTNPSFFSINLPKQNSYLTPGCFTVNACILHHHDMIFENVSNSN